MNDLKNSYRLLVYFTSFTVCSEDIKKKKKKILKMTSQLVIFRAFFFISSPYPKSDFFPHKSTNKKILALFDVTHLTLHGPSCKKSCPPCFLINFFMLNPTEHEIYHAHKCEIVGIITFISMVILATESFKDFFLFSSILIL